MFVPERPLVLVFATFRKSRVVVYSYDTDQELDFDASFVATLIDL